LKEGRGKVRSLYKLFQEGNPKKKKGRKESHQVLGGGTKLRGIGEEENTCCPRKRVITEKGKPVDGHEQERDASNREKENTFPLQLSSRGVRKRRKGDLVLKRKERRHEQHSLRGERKGETTRC